MVNRVVVGAHYGLRDWLIQRFSAAVMAVYCMSLAAYLLMQPILDYDVWTALFSSLPVRTFSLLFLMCLFYHAWIGVRDVVMDYVRPAGLRLAIHVLVILALIVYTISNMCVIWETADESPLYIISAGRMIFSRRVAIRDGVSIGI